MCPPSAVNAVGASDLPPPFLFLRDAGRGRRPFRSLPQAGACAPLGNNLSPVCGQCRQRFRFIAVPLPPWMPEGAAAPFRSLPPARKQFVSHQQSMPSALPIYRRRSSSSGDAGRGRRPFPFLPQAGACTPLGNNLSPVCGQCRRCFRFTAAVSLPPGMPEGAAAPSALFRRRGRVPRRGAIFCLSGRNGLLSSSLPSVPKTPAEGKSLPIHKSSCSAMPSTNFYASRQRGCFLFGEFSHRRKPATHTISGSVAIDRIVVAAKISDA